MVLLALILVAAAILSRGPQLPSVAAIVRITNDGKPKLTDNPFAIEGGNLYFVEGDPFTSGAGIAQVSEKGGETSWIETSLRDPVAIYSVSSVRPEMMVVVMSTSQGPLAGDVWVQPLPAGAPYPLANIISPGSITWTPDGSHIVYVDKQNKFFIANTDGTEPRQLATLPGMVWTLRFSPDGRRIRFTVLHPPDLDFSTIWEMNADGSNIHPLFPNWKDAPVQCCGNWSPDGKYFYFQTGAGPTLAIWALAEHRSLFGKTSLVRSRLTSGPPLHFGSPTPSSDGRTLFVVGVDSRVELFRHDPTTQRSAPYLHGVSAGPVSFSADGKWIAYTSYPDSTLWRSRIDGSEKMQLTFPPVRAYGARWSPDDSQIVFMDVQLARPWKIYVIPSTGGAPQRRTKDSIVDAETDPMWMPDGRSIIFGTQSTDKIHSAIQSLDLKSRNASPVQDSAGLISPRVSRDGQYISAFNSSQTELRLFDRRTNRWSMLASGKLLGYNEWSKDGNYVYMFLAQNGPAAVVRVRVKDRKFETVMSLKDFPVSTDIWAGWIGLAPDDSVLLMRDHSVQEIYGLHLQFHGGTEE